MVRPKTIAFISSEENLGMASILSDLAEAIATLDDTDYLLVDIPSKPDPSAASVISGCDLVMVVSSCKLDYIDETKNIVKDLLFLGIAPDKTAALLVDPEGILPSAILDSIRTYLETNLGIEMAAGISFDAKAEEISYQESPDSHPAQDILKLARYILAHGRRREEQVQNIPAEISL